MPMPMPIPGLTGIEHIGLTVPDIEAATTFFKDVLGAEALYDIGPFEDASDWMANHLAPVAGAHIYRMRVLRIANGPVLELMQFTAPARSGRLSEGESERARKKSISAPSLHFIMHKRAHGGFPPGRVFVFYEGG